MSVDELTAFATKDEPRNPRRAILVLITLGIIGAVIAVVLVTQRESKALAELRIHEDAVDARTEGGDFRKGVEGQGLAASDAVRTDDEGQAQIDFFDGSLIRLDSDSTLVIDALLNASSGQRFLLEQEGGRTWHRVEQLSGSQDRYEVKTTNAVASVRGTTFAVDMRFAPIIYYLGFEGETVVTAEPEGQQFSLLAGDCVRVDETGLRRCTDHELEDLMDDWISQNIAFDGGELEPGETVSPSPSATTTALRRADGGTGATPTPTPRPTRRPRPTEGTGGSGVTNTD